jgi:hypoxanthine phosphoribosyltransferase
MQDYEQQEYWRKLIPGLKTLYSAESISFRVKELAQQINEDYKGEELTILMLFTGSFIFAADLLRHITVPAKIKGMTVASYAGTTRHELTYDRSQLPEYADRHILIVDDIIDTGKTLFALKQEFEKVVCKSVKTCCLLDKESKRLVDLYPDYTGFIVPDYFVVGYGMDIDDKYRQIPFIGYIS